MRSTERQGPFFAVCDSAAGIQSRAETSRLPQPKLTGDYQRVGLSLVFLAVSFCQRLI